MTLPKFRDVRPQLAQRPDKRWVASALVFWEEHGADTAGGARHARAGPA